MGSEVGGFAGPERIGSTRAAQPGQAWCKCDDPAHRNHERPDRCGDLAYTNDGYCLQCHRLRGGSMPASEAG